MLSPGLGKTVVEDPEITLAILHPVHNPQTGRVGNFLATHARADDGGFFREL